MYIATCLRNENLPGNSRGRKNKPSQALRRSLGQAAIEMTLGLIACFMLFLCTVQLFVWLNRCLVERNKAYEDTRIIAGGYDEYGDVHPGAAFQDADPLSYTWTPPEFIPD